jgi:PKD repeat protein
MKHLSIFSRLLVNSLTCLLVYSLTFAASSVQAQTVYESLVLEDAFCDDRTAQADLVQGEGVGNLYVKGIAAGSGIRETFIKLSLDSLDKLTPAELDYAKVELRLYTVRSNADAASNQISVYPVANDWSETTLTWNNSRALAEAGIAAGAIASGAGKRIAGYSGSGQQGQPTDAYDAANESRFDISAYAVAQYKAGNKTVSLLLHVTNTVNNGDQQLASKDLAGDVPGYDLKLPKLITTQPAPFTVNDETLLGGNMESADEALWNINGAETFGDGSATWGASVDGFGTAGVLSINEENGTGTQYYIWQAVSLEAGSRYDLSFDYTVGVIQKAWCEVFIGTVLPGGADYSNGGARGTNPIAWNSAEQDKAADGAKTYSYSFIPEADGVYFYVIKAGANGNGKFHIAIDNVSLTKIVDPVADFTPSAQTTWIDVPVRFTNSSLNAVSYTWTFGDGETSTDESPEHTYTVAGDYTATLTVTGNGEVTDQKELAIKVLDVNEAAIAGGDMEASDEWAEFGGVSSGTNSQLVWGDTPNADRPKNYKPAGFETDGFLTVAEDWSGSVSYKIAQAVSLSAGQAYEISFDYAVGTHRRAWFQVFAGTTVPTDADYTDNRIGDLIPWSDDYTGDLGGTARHFAETFEPEVDSVYYIVIKWGCGSGAEGYFNTSIDNISLTVKQGPGTSIGAVRISEPVSRMTLYSVQGQAVLTVENTDRIPVEALAKGLYIVQLTGAQGTLSVHKIIVR